MKAIVFTNYGSPDVLQPREVATPVPKDNEVLIKIRATTVTAGDCEIRSFTRFPGWLWIPLRLAIGIFRPRIKIIGQEVAGDIAAVGKNVERFKVGDAVVAAPYFGGYAEYVCVFQSGMIVPKPSALSYEEAATLPTGGLTALHLLRKANIQPGQKVLIYGASGSIGTFAVQLARYYGAEVTAVCNTPNVETVKSLGATTVIDYTRDDFTKNGETYDIIFDAVGKNPFSRSIKSLTENGVYAFGNFGFVELVQGLWLSNTSKRRVIFWASEGKSDDLALLVSLVETGRLKAVIDRHYPLAQIVEAHRYVDTGQKTGNVVITVGT